MKKVCVVTATRAEYGLLRNVIRRIQEDDRLELCLAVTGTHLSVKYGHTLEEIREDNFPIAEQIPILSSEDGDLGVIKTMGEAAVRFGEMYERQRPDMLVVLGDRYELLPICQSAMILGIPITHISGGEITEGVIDDEIRHCITKMSHLHFPGCEAYRKRIIQMGEEPDRVFNYGDVGIENISSMDFLNKEELGESIEFSLEGPYACVTFHPATAEKGKAGTQFLELLRALEEFPGMKFIITKANSDMEGNIINQYIDEFVKHHENCRAYESLGIKRYLSALKHCSMVIGNSSSGIVEAPCFGIPTVNIGNRQKGRLQADSILNCSPLKESIEECIREALTDSMIQKARKTKNPYGDGNTSFMIVHEIRRFLQEGHGAQKKFYDLG